jgi:hypothetical protein
MVKADFFEKTKVYLLLLLVVLLAYLPVSSMLFALKNDALTDNFPPKFFLSAALQAGQIPIWNPYINFGLPVYADIGFAYWNPITWCFGLVGYNFYTLSAELLFYIWLGTIFTYDLMRQLGHEKITCYCIAIMFSCSGFFAGSLQFTNFITGAAFIPLCLNCYLKWQYQPGFKNSLHCAIAFYLLIACGHPAIPIGMLYFMVAFFIFQQVFKDRPFSWPQLQLLRHGLLLLLISLLVLPIIYSSTEILPFITRRQMVQQAQFSDTGFTLPAYLSFVFPFSTTSADDFWRNSGLLRNGYFSILGFALLIVAILQKKNGLQKTMFCTGILFLLLSAGGGWKEVIYSRLPILQYIRTNGEYRVFSIFSFLMIVSYPLNRLVQSVDSYRFLKLSKTVLYITLPLMAICILLSYKDGWIMPAQLLTAGTVTKLKWLLDNFDLPLRFFISLLSIAVLCTLAIMLYKKMPFPYLLLSLVLLDMVMHCYSYLPYAGVQTKSVAAMQALLTEAPPGIPIPGLSPIAENTRPINNKVIGCWSYYSKQPGTPEYCDYPIVLTATQQYFNSNATQLVANKPFVFLEKDNQAVDLRSFSNSRMQVALQNAQPDVLVVLQNNYRGWTAYENGLPLQLINYQQTFMAIELPPGKHLVEFIFAPRKLWMVLKFWVIAIIMLALIYFNIGSIKSFFPSWQSQSPGP